MKRSILVIFSLLFFSYTEFCQELKRTEGLILFHGMVLDAKTQTPLANSQIIINRSFSSVSGTDGKFAFYVNRNDTVVFSMLGYKPAILFISDTLKGREFIAGIYLNSDTLSIGEIIIVPRLTNLRSELLNTINETSVQIENAKFNLEVSAYQGRMGQNKLGDPASNYEVIRQRQREDAYSKGQIPSDKIVGISPLLLLPAAYLLMNGLPERPPRLQPHISEQELRQINKKYLESLKKK